MSQDKNKEVFTVTKTDGKEVTLCIKKPGPGEGRKAQVYYNQTFAAALQAGGLLRASVESHMRSQGLWDDKKTQQQTDLVKQLSELELKLNGGGMKLSDGKRLALQMRELRAKFRELLATRNSLDISTVEGQAENARFNALVALSLVYNDSGELYYKSVDDYLEHAGDTEAYKGAETLGQMMFKLDKNYENNLPENKFLRRFKFVDDELRLVNKDGQLVDEEGRLINKDGRYIDGSGDFVDRDGKPVDKDGNYLVEEKPFLDDDGNPIVEEPAPKTE